MAAQNLARRVDQLESQIAQLQAEVRSVKECEKPSWQRAVERFAGDEDLLEIFSNAMKLREAERKKAHAKPRARKS